MPHLLVEAATGVVPQTLLVHLVVVNIMRSALQPPVEESHLLPTDLVQVAQRTLRTAAKNKKIKNPAALVPVEAGVQGDRQVDVVQ